MATSGSAPDAQNHFLADHVARLAESYQRLTGRELFDTRLAVEAQARELFFAPFAVVSHNVGADPVFTYANRTALTLFEMSWEEFTALPSRLSAEPIHRSERARLLAEVSRKGYIDDYRGIRIARSGRRFRIEGATVWNLMDAAGQPYGQAALFRHWTFLE